MVCKVLLPAHFNPSSALPFLGKKTQQNYVGITLSAFVFSKPGVEKYAKENV